MSGIVIGAIAIHTTYAFVTDIRTRRIPNLWNGFAALAGLTFHAVCNGWDGLLMSSLGLLVLLVATVPLQLLGAIGGGDVKWFAALGAWAGVWFSLYALFYTLVVAGVIALFLFLLQGKIFGFVRQWAETIFTSVLLRSAAPLRAVKERPLKEIPLMIAAMPAVGYGLWQQFGRGIM